MPIALPRDLIEQLDKLLSQLQSAEHEVRSQAEDRLGEYEKTGRITLDLLLEMAEDENMTYAMYAITGLGRNKSKAAAAKLASMIDSPRAKNVLYLESLIEALGETESPDATSPLLHLIGIDVGWKSKILGRFTRKKEEADPNRERIRRTVTLPVIRALEKIADPKSAELIAEYLDHEDPLVRCHTIKTFMNAGFSQRADRLREMAQSDPNTLVRELADIAVQKLSAPANEITN